ncbi:hypothetical protein LUZ62_019392 [Rhynchospora pubera]|uniref:Uncharacterized protein n=1 Tax=Rhynchospora pubera TaxID=906938 RepID=A0AAV8GSI2_9POAL|nr:hypothetical protein LUZ62_013420 [Rhynchospora pubera]KAJ4787539.1 hypothetical protein LUZ62_038785 [Rhynchospora pubera]KAJ4806826.1 hypothetical protein LUZ62_019392 [Rhynchospora pubera]
MEEFLEAEVLWPETVSSGSMFSDETMMNINDRRTRDSQNRTGSSPSSPVNIPGSSGPHLSFESRKGRYEEECDKLVPPHVMVSRRCNVDKVAFSLRSGQGRTLRGRELWHIRNAVWKMTGFLDG